MPYVATINVPGYLPEDDDPPVFETAREAWSYLADERARGEDDFADVCEVYYSATWLELLELYATGHIGTVYGPTPGYDGEHDLGLAYSVSLCEDPGVE